MASVVVGFLVLTAVAFIHIYVTEENKKINKQAKEEQKEENNAS